MGQKLLIKLVNLGPPPVPTGPPASNKGIWGGAGVVSGGPPKILELHYSATVFQHCGTPNPSAGRSRPRKVTTADKSL